MTQSMNGELLRSFSTIQEGIAAASESVSRLRKEIGDLQRVRDLAIIHLQQLELDTNLLRTIHQELKAKIEASQGRQRLPSGGVDCRVSSPDAFFRETHVRLRYAIAMDSILCALKFNCDGSLIAFSDRKAVFLIASGDGEVVGKCEVPALSPQQSDPLPRSICFSADSRFLAVSGQSASVLVIEVASRSIKTSLNLPHHVVSSIAFFQDGHAMVTGGFDGKLCLWSVPEFQLMKVIQHGIEGQTQKKDMIVAVAFGKGDLFLGVAFMNGMVGIYEKTFSQPMASFQAHTDILLSLAISPEDVIATASHDKTAQLWSVRGVAARKHVLRGHEDYVLTVAFAPQDPVVFTGSKDETIKCWSQKTGENLFTVRGHRNTLFQLDHHPTDRTIVSCGGDGLLCVWDYDLP
jgi:WD40 repeat protein